MRIYNNVNSEENSSSLKSYQIFLRKNLNTLDCNYVRENAFTIRLDDKDYLFFNFKNKTDYYRIDLVSKINEDNNDGVFLKKNNNVEI